MSSILSRGKKRENSITLRGEKKKRKRRREGCQHLSRSEGKGGEGRIKLQILEEVIEAIPTIFNLAQHKKKGIEMFLVWLRERGGGNSLG